MSAFQLTDLNFRYHPQGPDVIGGVSLSVDSGEIVALRGRSGGGKSTLLRLASGLLSPSAGEVTIGGEQVKTAKDRRDLRAKGRTSMVFQDFNLVPELTALENVLLGLKLAGRPKRAGAAREALDAVGVLDLAQVFPAGMSGGEQQRVAIARALALESPLLLADEPTGALDAENALLVMECMRHVADRGCGVLIATHDPEVYERSDRVEYIEKGRLVPCPSSG